MELERDLEDCPLRRESMGFMGERKAVAWGIMIRLEPRREVGGNCLFRIECLGGAPDVLCYAPLCWLITLTLGILQGTFFLDFFASCAMHHKPIIVTGLGSLLIYDSAIHMQVFKLLGSSNTQPQLLDYSLNAFPPNPEDNMLPAPSNSSLLSAPPSIAVNAIQSISSLLHLFLQVNTFVDFSRSGKLCCISFSLAILFDILLREVSTGT